MTYKVEFVGGDAARPRLSSRAPLTSADFDALCAQMKALGVEAIRARKTGFIAVEVADREQEVVTRWLGVETTNRARAGDWIATSLDRRLSALGPGEDADACILRDPDGNADRYVISRDDKKRNYRAIGRRTSAGEVHAWARAEGPIEAIHFAGGFDIVAPWGERQARDAGYIVRNDAEVYGIFDLLFEATYEPVG